MRTNAPDTAIYRELKLHLPVKTTATSVRKAEHNLRKLSFNMLRAVTVWLLLSCHSENLESRTRP